MEYKGMFFSFSHNSFVEENWVWGAEIVPALDTISSPCFVCGNGLLYPSRYPERPLSVVIESGSRYPDILGCGAYPLLIISESVADAWKENGLRGFNLFPLTIANPIKKTPNPPKYFHVHVTGRCNINFKKIGVEVIESCPKCGYIWVEPFDFEFHITEEDKNDDSDFFVNEYFPQVVFCTERVRELAIEMLWTNVAFEPICS
jgi:hypothetical protein